MALPLEFKRRVRLPDPGEPPQPRPRRSPALALGVSTWLVAVALAWGVSAGTLPVGRWLDATSARAPEPASAPRSHARQARARAPGRVTPTPALAPLEPVAANEPSPEPAARPTEPATPEPAPTPTSAAPEPVPVAARAVPEPEPAPVAAPEPAPEPAPAPVPPPPRDDPAPSHGSSAGQSCEAAAAAYQDEIKIGGDRGPADLSAEDYARVLNAGAWFGHCGVPASSRVDVCVAVQNGRAKGVTVRLSPANARVERCVAQAASRLAFPSHPRLDVARTHFE